jgi:hypothetical protein
MVSLLPEINISFQPICVQILYDQPVLVLCAHAHANHRGFHLSFPRSLLSGTLPSDGASAVARVSDRGRVCVLFTAGPIHKAVRGGRRVEDMCVCFVYYQPNSSHRGGPLSRPPAGCALGSASVGNPFDRVWPPTTSGDLQPIFSCVDLLLDSRGTHPIGVL